MLPNSRDILHGEKERKRGEVKGGGGGGTGQDFFTSQISDQANKQDLKTAACEFFVHLMTLF